MSNLVLMVGLPEKKAVSLLDKEQVLLKRFEHEVDAKRLADKFQQAGMHCVVDERGRGGASGDSILMSIFSKFTKSSDKS